MAARSPERKSATTARLPVTQPTRRKISSTSPLTITRTLFDAIQVKAPAEATLTDRVRMNNLALSIVLLSQGVPFFHAGDDILRSKSFNPNSYNSGDWFNKLDWTYESNNWGIGLPLEGTEQWDIYKPLLADPDLAAHESGH